MLLLGDGAAQGLFSACLVMEFVGEFYAAG